MTNKRPSGVSQLDSLWLALGGYQTSNQSEGQSKENILVTEQKLTETINEVTGGCISTLQFNEETSQLIGTTSDGQQISIVNLPKEVHIVDFKVRNITQEDIDKGCTYDLDTQVLSIKTSDNQEYVLSVKELNVEILGSESDTISTRVIDGVVNSQLKINNGNNQLSTVELKTSSDGIYADIKIGETDGVKLEKSSSGLTAKIPMSNDFVKFELITWSDYSILENKAQNTVYFLSDKPYIYLNGVKYGTDPDSLEELKNKVEYNSNQVSYIYSLRQDIYSLQNYTIPPMRTQLDNCANNINTLTEQVNTCTEQVGTCTTKVEEMTEQVNSNTDFINTISPSFLDQLAYGVEWDVNVADPHITRIGNMNYHRTLPIQSQLKGCIAQGGKIIYWLNETDWRFKKEPETVSIGLTVDGGYSLVSDIFSNLRYEKQWVKINNVPCQINSINTSTNTATLVANDELDALNLSTGTQDVELGSVLNGYDGTVRVYCPKFYIKSESDGDYRRVWISESNVDGKFTEQPSILIDAYKSTVLNTVPKNMGYLSTLSVDSAISVVNTNTYCRGGGNRSSYDVYLETDPFRSDLCKPRTGRSKTAMRRCSRNSGSQVLSYEQYKNIFYWLYVIEYANFNCQEEYNEELTAEGFRQGGLGRGIVGINITYLSYYNDVYSPVPCGYCNELGNNTGLKIITFDTPTDDHGNYPITYTKPVPRWRGFDNPFGDTWTILEGIIIQKDTEGDSDTVYTTTDPNNYGDDEAAKNTMKIAGYATLSNGYTKEFDLGEAAHIIPESVGGTSTTYKCDYYDGGGGRDGLRILIVGGCVTSETGMGNGGISSFNSAMPEYIESNTWGIRSVSNFESFPEN